MSIDTFNLQRVNQTDTGDNSDRAKELASQAELIKTEAAKLLTVMLVAKEVALKGAVTEEETGEIHRRFAVAKTELETAVMWAVKGLFVSPAPEIQPGNETESNS